MKTIFLGATLAAAVLISGSVLAQGAGDQGKREYDSNCASCHGLSGKGDGPMSNQLAVKPTDLTTITMKNGGVFPVARIRTVIDGRMEINSHGSRVMPVWGDDYTAQAGTDFPNYMGVAFNPEVFVRSRIMALVDYLNRVQVK